MVRVLGRCRAGSWGSEMESDLGIQRRVRRFGKVPGPKPVPKFWGPEWNPIREFDGECAGSVAALGRCRHRKVVARPPDLGARMHAQLGLKGYWLSNNLSRVRIYPDPMGEPPTGGGKARHRAFRAGSQQGKSWGLEKTTKPRFWTFLPAPLLSRKYTET